MENPVYDYLNREENKNKRLSAKTMGKRLGISNKSVYYYIIIDGRIKRVPPYQYGYGGNTSRVFMLNKTK